MPNVGSSAHFSCLIKVFSCLHFQHTSIFRFRIESHTDCQNKTYTYESFRLCCTVPDISINTPGSLSHFVAIQQNSRAFNLYVFHCSFNFHKHKCSGNTKDSTENQNIKKKNDRFVMKLPKVSKKQKASTSRSVPPLHKAIQLLQVFQCIQTDP